MKKTRALLAASLLLAAFVVIQPLGFSVTPAKSTPATKTAPKTLAPLKTTIKPAATPPAKLTTTQDNQTLTGYATHGRKLDLLRNIPLETSTYLKDGTLPPTFTSADQIMKVLNEKRNLLVHMEAIRRSYSELGPAEQEKLVTTLFQRYRALNEDPVRFFDYGYAQLVLKDNKTGLFFLRKANDAIKDQFSSLAYGMAQAEADLNFEQGDPAQMTTRKLDSIFMFKDAVKRDAKAHKPGFWPTYVRVMEQLKPIGAYNDLVKSDLSVYYVPYGNSVFPDAPPQPKYVGTAFLAAAGGSTCQPYDPFKKLTSQALYNQRNVDFNGDGQNLNVQFYTDSTKPNSYQVVVSNSNGTLANFDSPVAPYIVEDIDADGKYEFVVRQYEYDPLHPIKVYRYNSCRFEQDADISANFE